VNALLNQKFLNELDLGIGLNVKEIDEEIDDNDSTRNFNAVSMSIEARRATCTTLIPQLLAHSSYPLKQSPLVF
jgi:hypothetical protein